MMDKDDKIFFSMLLGALSVPLIAMILIGYSLPEQGSYVGSKQLTNVELTVVSNTISKRSHVELEGYIDGDTIPTTNDNGYYYKRYQLNRGDVVHVDSIKVFYYRLKNGSIRKEFNKVDLDWFLTEERSYWNDN